VNQAKMEPSGVGDAMLLLGLLLGAGLGALVTLLVVLP
jgi:hypothetical protein